MNAFDVIVALHENTVHDHHFYTKGRIYQKQYIFNHTHDSTEMDTSLARKQKIVPNPLKIFPAKHDNIVHSFFGVDEPKGIPKINQRDKFSGQVPAQPPVRSFRRMNGQGSLFTAPVLQQVPLSDLHTFKEEARKNFVLVEESRLIELTRLENSLREEKQKIAISGNQSSFVLSDFQVDPRIPLPATRLAIHNVCEAEMRKLAQEIERLNTNWVRFCKDNHYVTMPVYTKDAYENRGPLHIRRTKIQLAKEAADKYSVRRDRDTMMFEDDMSYFVGKYYDAQSRKRDYDRYYILANRYKPFSEHEYIIDGNPGKRYLLKVLKGAVKWQKAWFKYQGVRRLHLFLMVRRVQCKWRRYCARKNIYPIIRMRIRFGPRTYYMYCMFEWKKYNRIVKAIKKAINYKLENCISTCFVAWKGWARAEKDRKTAVLKRLAMRMKYSPVICIIWTWAKWAKRSMFIKRKVRRIFSRLGMYIDTWTRYTQYSKKLKVLSKTAIILQGIARMFIKKNKFKKMRRGVKVLCKFAIQVMGHGFVKRRREAMISVEFVVWKPEELARRLQLANEDELRRLQRMQLLANEKGKKALIDIKKHLNSVNGDAQLAEIRKQVWKEASILDRLKIGTVSSRAEKLFQERVKKANHILGRHDFSTKFKPPMTCPVPSCCRTFTTFDQYQEHEKFEINDAIHQPFFEKTNESPYLNDPKYLTSYTEFHRILTHPKGSEMLKLYISRVDGLGVLFNCVDVLMSIQEWKRTESINKLYTTRAMSMYDTFLRFDAIRPVDISYDHYEQQIEAFESVRNRDSDGFLRPTRATRSVLRTILQVSAQPYNEWTEKNQVQPDAFLQIEFHCFYKLFYNISRDINFVDSPEFAQWLVVQAEEAKQTELNLLNDYKTYRLNNYRTWAKSFLKSEKELAKLSYIAVDQFMDFFVDDLVHSLCLKAATVKTRTMRNNEQKVREKSNMLADEGAEWATLNMAEYIFDHFVTKLINCMWKLPQYRDGFLEYVGLRKVAKKKLVVDKNARNKKGEFDWYDKLLREEFEAERATFVLTRREAILRVQMRVRGMWGRKKMKKLVAKHITKVWSDDHNSYVYKNGITGDVTVDRPSIIRFLFPNSKW